MATQWASHPLVLRVKSPIHIGWRKTGNLMQTRPYVPARVVLGAWTAILTQRLGLNRLGWQGYRAVGETLNALFRVSYFYPAIEENNTLQIRFFWEDPERFAFQFLGSTLRTALDPSGIAAEGGVFEVEHLLPHTRDTGKPVYLVGCVWIRFDGNDHMENLMNVGDIIRRNLEHQVQHGQLDSSEAKAIQQRVQETLKSMGKFWNRHPQTLIRNMVGEVWFLGGERTYGWGKVEVVRETEVKTCQSDIRKQNQDEDAGPRLEIPEGSRLEAHLLTENVGEKTVAGPVEPLVRREWRRHAGSTVTFGGVAWEPGSVVLERTEVVVGPLGYWIAR